jgi:DNA repair protein RadA/Sms
MRWAKGRGVPVIIVGHVTKEGDIAGPKMLEHMVDVVLYLEGEKYSSYRLLRGVKNRFGSAAEVGVFEMTEEGLMEVENPSALFLSGRGSEAVGSVVMATMEGSRPLLVEVQALTSPSFSQVPRRIANGVDMGRLLVVTAVLSRRLGLPLGNQDVIVSAVGGLRVAEPAADLAIALAIISSHRGRPLPQDMVVMGEVGLSGELRYVPYLERRLAEARRLGFQRALVPRAALRRPSEPGTEVLAASTIREALALAWPRG